MQADQKVTTYLNTSEQNLLVKVALNLDSTIKEIADEIGDEPRLIEQMTLTLEEEGFLERGEDQIWNVTQLGVVELMKYSQLLRFKRMQAMIKQKDKELIINLEKLRNLSRKAYLNCDSP
jgi:predicted transcriptional regulator of viral defense system